MSKRKGSGSPLDKGTTGRTGQKRKGEAIPDEGKRRKVESPAVRRPACDACGRILGLHKQLKCEGSHLVCEDCVEDSVQLVFVQDLDFPTCPVKDCEHGFSLDELYRLKPSMVIEMLEYYIGIIDNNSVNWVFSENRCPGCQSLVPDDGSILVKCPFKKCAKSHCYYCQEVYATIPYNNNLNIQHFGCGLLHFDDPRSLRDAASVPTHWKTSGEDSQGFCAVQVPLGSPEGVQVVDLYTKTSNKSKVTRIERIENKVVWQRYVAKREEMLSSLGAENLKERFMFHGSPECNIESICRIGFDVTKANCGAYGRGIYFSTCSNISQTYANKFRSFAFEGGRPRAPNSARVFIGRVLIGKSRTGGVIRSPDVDTIVDNAFSSMQCAVFSSKQTYPAYLVDVSF